MLVHGIAGPWAPLPSTGSSVRCLSFFSVSSAPGPEGREDLAAPMPNLLAGRSAPGPFTRKSAHCWFTREPVLSGPQLSNLQNGGDRTALVWITGNRRGKQFSTPHTATGTVIIIGGIPCEVLP